MIVGDRRYMQSEMSGDLVTYLNDHYTGSVGAIDLARQGARQYAGSELGSFLSTLAREIEEDREALRRMMRVAEARPHRVKHALAWAGGKAMMIKLRMSPQPLMLLETLALGITGTALGWRALAAAGNPVGAPLDDLIARAERQLAGVEEHRLAAARTSLAA
jgi:hypothetical protein